MKNQGYAEIILRFLRTIIFIDTNLSMIVALVGFVLKWQTFAAYGMALLWVGIGLIFFSCLIGAGGVSSRLGDTAAFLVSGAGNMSENLKQISEAGRSSLGCFFLLLVAGLVLLILGYILPVIPLLFR